MLRARREAGLFVFFSSRRRHTRLQGDWSSDVCSSDLYINLRGVRQENRDLKAQLERLRIEQLRMQEDAAQGRRLQAVLRFKEQMISQTVEIGRASCRERV